MMDLSALGYFAVVDIKRDPSRITYIVEWEVSGFLYTLHISNKGATNYLVQLWRIQDLLTSEMWYPIASGSFPSLLSPYQEYLYKELLTDEFAIEVIDIMTSLGGT